MAYLGKSPSQGVRNRYYFTASGGETSISGALTGGTLTFTDGNYVDVNLNGVTLVAGTDYNTSTANTIAGLSALTASDVVEIVVYDVFSVFSGNVNSDFSVGGNLSVTGTTAFTGATTITGLTTTGDINFGDNDKAIFGAGSDLQIYHDGSNSFIDDAGTGNVFLRGSSQVIIGNMTGEQAAVFNDNGAVTLNYDNAQKLATTNTGVDVTGVITTDGMTTSADINFGDNDKAIFGAGSDLQIYHDGSNSFIVDNGTGGLQLRGSTFVALQGTNGENGVLVTENGSVQLRFNNSPKLETTGTGCTITGDIANASGNMTIDIAGDLNLDADGGNVLFKDGGTEIGRLSNSSSNLDIRSSVSNKDMFFTVSGSERMRIDSDGRILIADSTNVGTADHKVSIQKGSSGRCLGLGTTVTTASVMMSLVNGNGTVGSIQTNGTSTSYVTSSDYRLKENVTADWDATTRLKQLNPVRFNFIADADTTFDGFLAHEVQSVVPEAITGTKDEVDADGNPVMQSIDQSKIVPLLVKTIQELEARIAALET